MRIVIVGDGKVGKTLTEQLSQEGHDIVVIDQRAEALVDSTNSSDVIGIQGNGASYDVQVQAGVPKSDLMIAATSTDEFNILCCLIARKLGAKHTIARMRNPDYGNLALLKEDLGLNLVINPDRIAAREIARILRFPTALNIETFVRGRVELVEIKIQEGNPLCDLPLYNLYKKLQIKVLVCAVQREDKVYIPSGNFVLRSGDKIHITASPSEIVAFCKKVGIFRERIRSVMIVGGSRIAYYLTLQLLEMNMQVKIIEKDYNRCLELSEHFPKATVVHGDGTNQSLLHEEGIDSVDAFVSLMSIDEENIITSLYAHMHKVSKVVAKVDRLSFLDVLGDTTSLDSVVSPRFLTANQITRYVRAMQNSEGSNMETLHRMVNNRVEALEFHVGSKGDFLHVPLAELSLKPNLLIACIVRGPELIIPGGSDTIEPDDSVVVVSSNARITDLKDILK